MDKRKIWFITRPERDPKYHIDALKALKIATNDFLQKSNIHSYKRRKYIWQPLESLKAVVGKREYQKKVRNSQLERLSKKKKLRIEAGRVEERIIYGHTIKDKNILFEELALDWLNNHKKTELESSTYEQYEMAIRLHILPEFGRRKAMLIKRTDIKKWVNQYSEIKKPNGDLKYSYGTRIRYLSVLKSKFHYAVHEIELLEKSLAIKLSPPKVTRISTKQIKYFSLNELNQLLDYMDGYKTQRFSEYNYYRMLMYFLSQPGLRISEALALRWSDIHDGKVTVERQTSRGNNNQIVLKTLKSTSSYRTIGLNPDLIEELSQFKWLQEKLSSMYDTFKTNSDEIIFQNSMGNYLTPSVVREVIKGHCKRAGVSYKGTHGFRHTHAVLLLEAVSSLLYVSKWLGYKFKDITSSTY